MNSRHFVYLDGINESTPHKLVAQVQSEVKVVWRRHDSVDQLHARILKTHANNIIHIDLVSKRDL